MAKKSKSDRILSTMRCHALEYKGHGEGKGIWGNRAADSLKGGFYIWPFSEGPGLNAAGESEIEEKPAGATR
jgi:hypothetical protein